MLRNSRNLLVRSVLLLGVVMSGSLAVSAQSATPVPAAYGGVPSTAILVGTTNDPRAVPGSDGHRHLEYDLLVTNTDFAPVRFTYIDVLAPDGARLMRLEGDALVTATQPVLGVKPQAEIPPSGTVAVVMDVALPGDAAADRLDHRIGYDIPADAPDQAIVGSREVSGPDLPVAAEPTVLIAAPLAGDGWMTLNGCCAATSIHRFVRVSTSAAIAKAEMFAIDWVQVNDGLMFTGDGSQPDQFIGYGAEVRSVAAGTVVYARDDMSDQALGEVTGIERAEDYSGNQVMVEIGSDVYAWYAHLAPGSVMVAVGDTVSTGQPLGRLGNSGNSTAPHLHFGLLDAPNAVTGNGVPMVIDAYDLVGTIDPAILTSATPLDGRLPIDTASQGSQTETLPLFMTVANFHEE